MGDGVEREQIYVSESHLANHPITKKPRPLKRRSRAHLISPKSKSRGDEHHDKEIHDAIALITALCVASKYSDDACERIRKPIHLLTDHELMLYVDGLQAIRSNGKFQVMVDAHAGYTEVHRGSSFFFYHSYYVWEVETQIRALGGRFECFSLPYYDWTVDAGHERHPTVLHSVFGGDGDDDMHCVATPRDLWTTERWPLHELCGSDEGPDAGCCLKRALMQNHSISDAAALAPVLQRSDFLAFDGGVLMAHQMVHWLFGNGDECESCHMATGYSMDDVTNLTFRICDVCTAL